MQECSICKQDFTGYGNNPYPVRTSPNAVCCDKCNIKYVIPYRIILSRMNAKAQKDTPKVLNTYEIKQLDWGIKYFSTND